VTESKPSKSELKRQQQTLQRLGEQLIGLSDELLQGLTLNDRLLDAINDIRRMKSHEAIRRQKQYIGKLMRDVDPAPIQALLERLRADDRRQKRIFADAERWRDRLVHDGVEALEAFAIATGGSNPDLRTLLEALDQAKSDRVERDIRKRIFRATHAALVAQSRDG